MAESCELSRSYLQQLIAGGHVFLEGSGAPAANPTAKVRAGDRFRIEPSEAAPLALEPVAMALDILFEDTHLLVINKPAGLTVHPASSTQEPTLVHGLLAHCAGSLSGIGGVARPGIVHRLDKDTSGLMLVAKTDAAHQHLSAQLKDRSLSRTYEALCWGAPSPASGTVDAPIGRHPKDRTRMAVVRSGGRDARTHYETLTHLSPPFRGEMKRGVKSSASNDDAHPLPCPPPEGEGMKMILASHIRCKLETGRTHQIRVHLNHIGCGLIGDPVYGQSTEKRLQKYNLTFSGWTREPGENRLGPSDHVRGRQEDVLLNFRRQALHAAGIRFIHPASGEAMQFACPLPQDMAELLSALST